MNIGEKASTFVEDGMVVGLGTGRSASLFIENLALKKKRIVCVASSFQSERLAKERGLKIISIDDIEEIDLTVDGADQVDKKRWMVKGRGGALLKEKILISSSKRVIIVIMENKLVDNLGNCKLPVEVVPFGRKFTEKRFNDIGFFGEWRMEKENLFVTDGGNLIFDIDVKDILSPRDLEKSLLVIPGVVETGLFFNKIDELIVGFDRGGVEIR